MRGVTRLASEKYRHQTKRKKATNLDVTYFLVSSMLSKHFFQSICNVQAARYSATNLKCGELLQDDNLREKAPSNTPTS